MSASVYGKVGEWSEVAVPVPYMTTFSSSWFYTFTSLQSATVYDVVGMGKGICLQIFHLLVGSLYIETFFLLFFTSLKVLVELLNDIYNNQRKYFLINALKSEITLK